MLSSFIHPYLFQNSLLLFLVEHKIRFFEENVKNFFVDFFPQVFETHSNPEEEENFSAIHDNFNVLTHLYDCEILCF